jgi:hypothetical protein
MTMQSPEAFATLVREAEAALQASLARHATAAQQGDFDVVETELERQRNLVAVRQQLQGLRELWGGLMGTVPSPPQPPPPEVPRGGRAIFVRYKGQRVEARLLADRRVVVGNETYSSPSAAASAVARGTSVNGWRFWHFIDQRGREQPIGHLRR